MIEFYAAIVVGSVVGGVLAYGLGYRNGWKRGRANGYAGALLEQMEEMEQLQGRGKR